MKSVLTTLLLGSLCLHARAQTIVYQQPHNGTGSVYHSSWWDPDGSPWDEYCWDSFTLPSATAITEIRWRGGFDPAYWGGGGPVLGYTVELWSSIQGGSQPDIGSVFAPNPLRRHIVTGNCNQTPAGTFGGVAMYDYRLTLPTAFQAAGATKYWVRIFAWQHGTPDWGFAAGSGGDGSRFRKMEEYNYQMVPGDTTFAILTQGGATFNIAASGAPPGTGTVTGAGTYPAGTMASLVANPNAGFGFVNWTESGSPVSSNQTYEFNVTADRTLVANFTTAYAISTSAAPNFGGFTTGDGIYNTGTTVTVSATANAGYSFTQWTEFGTPVSASASYSFSSAANRTLVANFVPAGTAVLFNLDNAPIHTSLPIDLMVDGLAAHFSATGSGFSIQQANTMGFTPAGFGGLCLYPNSVFPADLIVSFSGVLTDFSIMYSPQELGCDDTSMMRVTAYLGAALVGTNTTTAPFPGTWPTGTLSISIPGGFDRVIVHYDTRPPTCQDWGPIFLADNMLATIVCNAPAISQQPVSDAACTFGGSSFFSAATGTLPVQHLWQAELDPGVWTDLADGNLVHNGIVIGVVWGAASDWMQIDSLTQFLQDRQTLNIRCTLSNDCGSAVSDVASLTVWPTATGDINLDGLVNALDIQFFIDNVMLGWGPTPAGCAADLDNDGWVDDSEVPALVTLLLSQ